MYALSYNLIQKRLHLLYQVYKTINILPYTQYSYYNYNILINDYDYFSNVNNLITQYNYDTITMARLGVFLKHTESELDTGFDYTSTNSVSRFGARLIDADKGVFVSNYASDLSIWLSVDPLSDMYPSTSPFMYVRGNPIMLIDPTGMNDDYYENEDGDVIYRDGHAANVTKDGDTYKNIGSTYSKDNGDGSYSHYVQNEYLGTNNGSIGSLLQHGGYLRRGTAIAKKYSDKTVSRLNMKAFDYAYESSSKNVIIGTLSVPALVITAGELMALSPLASEGLVWYEYNTGTIGAYRMAYQHIGVWLTTTASGEIVTTFMASTLPLSATNAFKSRIILEKSLRLMYKTLSAPSANKMSIDEINKEMKSNWQINSGTGPE